VLELELTKLCSELDAEYAFKAIVAMWIGKLNPRNDDVGSGSSAVELAAYFLYPHFGESICRDAAHIQELIDILDTLNGLRGIVRIFSERV